MLCCIYVVVIMGNDGKSWIQWALKDKQAMFGTLLSINFQKKKPLFVGLIITHAERECLIGL